MATRPTTTVFNLGRIIERHAQETPHRIAAVSPVATLTYGELDERADQLATLLERAGVTPGSRVAHLDHNAVEAAELLVATSRLGAAYSPFNWRLSQPELTELMRHAEPRVLIAGSTYRDVAERIAAAAGSQAELIVYDEHAPRPWADQSRSMTRHETAAEDLAVLNYTSGTTGTPKGVMLTASNLQAMHELGADTFNIHSESRVLIALPLFHVGGVTPLVVTLQAGARAIVVPRVVPDELLETMGRENVTTSILVPTVLHTLCEVPGAAERDWSHLETQVYGGSPITAPTLLAAMRTFGCGFVQLYGATENMALAARLDSADHDPGGPREHLLRSAGKPLRGTEFEIVGESGEPLPHGTIGELRVRGPQVMAGYLNNPQQTESALSEDGWLSTGDVGYLDEEGYFYITDRLKDMIISGGENVYSAEVENVLAQYPGVSEVAVIGLPHPTWVETVAALIVPRDGATIDPDELVAFARAHLAGYKIPRSVTFVPDLPKTPSGKIRKQELRERYAAQEGTAS